MAFTKFIYNLINWKNKSESLTTPLGASNLNKMDSAIKTIGDNLNTVYDELSEGKLDKDTANTMISNVSYDESTGIFTITRLNGSSITIDTKLEKIVTNWKYDKDSQKLILTLDDGTTQEVDLSALITQYEFIDSDTIAFTIKSDGSVTANVKDGSITEEKLQPNYLAEVKSNASNAETSAQNASDCADDASYDAKLAQSYAIGGSGIRDGEDTSNAKYYSEQANKEANNASGFAESASSFAENANRSASYASSYANTASTHASNASSSAESASESADSASKSANLATGSAENANTSAELANRYSNYASGYANTASTHASNASASAESASESASAAEESAKNAKAEADKIVEIAGGDIVLQSEKGAVNGVAPLDENALIPLEYVPDNPLLKDNASKNLLEVTATSQTFNGVTFTVNDDGSVTVNGTASKQASFILNIECCKYDHDVIVSGCPSGGNQGTYSVLVNFWSNAEHTAWVGENYEVGNGLVVSPSEKYWTVSILVREGVTIENLTFYPMIRRAEITDDTYEPYYATNKELTKIVKEGSVNSADKLANPVNIGKASFDGSSDITLADIMGRATCTTSGSDNAKKYTKIATIDVSSGAYTSCDAIIQLHNLGASTINGLLHVYIATDSTTENANIFLQWMYLSSLLYETTITAVKVSNGVFDLYFSPQGTWFNGEFTMMQCSYPDRITLHSKQEYVDSVEAVATSSLSGYVERALKDVNGNVIHDTYMTKKNPTGTGTFSMNRRPDSVVGNNSSTLGSSCRASGDISHAEGSGTVAKGKGSHSEGNQTVALGNYSHIEGASTNYAQTDGTDDEIIEAWESSKFSLAKGENSHVEGIDCLALGKNTHAEGYQSKAIASTVPTASAHAEGMKTIAEGNWTHAEGNGTKASGQSSHAEGKSTIASGSHSHAEGGETIASGLCSHAGGIGTVAGYKYQTAIGAYNSNKEENIFEVGNGEADSDEDRSNALELTREGDLKVAGGFKGNADTATKALQDSNGLDIAANYMTIQSFSDQLVSLALKNKHSSSTGGNKSFSVSAGSIIVLSCSNSSGSGNYLVIAYVAEEGVLSSIYKSDTVAACNMSLSGRVLTVSWASKIQITILS